MCGDRQYLKNSASDKMAAGGQLRLIDTKGRTSSLVWEHLGFQESDEEQHDNVQDFLQGDICSTGQHNKSIQPSETKAQSHSQRINKETKRQRQGDNPPDINPETDIGLSHTVECDSLSVKYGQAQTPPGQRWVAIILL